MTTRDEIIQYARTFVGTRFHHQGRNPKLGLDCVGVIACVAQKFEQTFHDLQGYSNRPDGVTLTREFEKCLVPIRHPEVQPGDVLTFWIEQPNLVQHCALATDRGILHSALYYRKVVEHSMDSLWQGRLAKAYRFPNIDPTPYPKKFPWMMVDPEVARRLREASIPNGRGCCGG